MGQIHESIIAIMSELDAIAKDKKNTQQNFNYRGIDDVYNCLHHLMAKHGVFTTSDILEMQAEQHLSKSGGVLFYEKLKIKYTFFAKDGSSIDTIVKGIGMDSGDKAANKAMSIAHKYALLQIFAIPTQDVIDPDSESYEVKQKVKSKKIEGHINPSPLQPGGFPSKEPPPPPTEQPTDDLITTGQIKALCTVFQTAIQIKLSKEQYRDFLHQYVSAYFQKNYSSIKFLTKDEASKIIDAIIADKKDVDTFVSAKMAQWDK